MSAKVFMLIIFSLLECQILGRKCLDFLSSKRQIPITVSDIYGRRTLEKWQTFRTKLTRFDLIRSIISYVLIMCSLLIISNIEDKLSVDEVRSLMVIGPIIIIVLIGVLRIPLDYYREIVLHRAYGFNNITTFEFFMEELLLIVLSGAVISIPAYLTYAFIFAPELHSDFDLSNARISPVPFVIIYLIWMIVRFIVCPVIRNLREHSQELEDGGLRDQLVRAANSIGYTGRICVCKKTRDASTLAYYTYIGNKVVICEDNLKEMNEDEITAIVLREMNRAVERDIYKEVIRFVVSAVPAIFTVWMLGLTLTRSGVRTANDVVNLSYACLAIVGVMLFNAKTILINYYSRRSVLNSDAAATRCGYGEDLICILKHMAKKDFEDLNPHPLRERLFDDYPSLHHRIQAIRAIENVSTTSSVTEG